MFELGNGFFIYIFAERIKAVIVTIVHQPKNNMKKLSVLTNSRDLEQLVFFQL